MPDKEVKCKSCDYKYPDDPGCEPQDCQSCGISGKLSEEVMPLITRQDVIKWLVKHDINPRRWFELHGFDVWMLPSPRIVKNYRKEGYIPYHHGTSEKRGHLPNVWTKGRLQEAMGIDWMTIKELAQAIPPAYSEFLGKQLMKYLDSRDRERMIFYQEDYSTVQERIQEVLDIPSPTKPHGSAFGPDYVNEIGDWVNSDGSLFRIPERT